MKFSKHPCHRLSWLTRKSTLEPYLCPSSKQLRQLNDATTSTEIGRVIEQLVARWLQQRGLKLISANFRVNGGEIDLVALDGNSLVFIEIKYRYQTRYGSAQEQVHHLKRHRLLHAARCFLFAFENDHLDSLKRHQLPASYQCRFDVIAVSGSELFIDWIQSAFTENNDSF